MTIRLLLVEDSPTDAKLVLQEVGSLNRPVEWERVETEAALRAACTRDSWDIILSDWSLPQFSAPAALRVVKELGLDTPFIIVSGTIGEEAAVEAMRAGARDYILKDKLARLAPAIERELREYQERLARRRAEEARAQAEEALKSSERQLRHAQKLEAIALLAGGVAHDFNNLLSVILANGDLILADLKEADPLRAEVAEICVAAKRGAALTRQLLLFSSKQVLEPKTLDPNEILRGMDKMLQRLLGEDVELSTCTNARGSISADPGHIEQVIMNLVVNARDAMPTGGKLTIETADVELDEAYVLQHPPLEAGAYVMLAVTDTGTGMDEATQARIFEPFFTTKERGKGTGLGLSTVFGIVQQTGGSIRVSSKPGQGTTFKIYLPRVHGGHQRPQSASTPRTLRGDETVLLVEDDLQVRVVVANILRRYGYQVIVAESGADALARAERHGGNIDLLLSDVVMPGMSGPALAQCLSGARPSMKVLFISGYADDSILRYGLASGVVAYLHKPITPVELVTKLREVLAQPRPGAPRAS